MWRALAFLVLPLIAAAQPDYFPLLTGNQWIYRGSRPGQSMAVEVTGMAAANGMDYYLVRGFPQGEKWLRRSEDGALYAYEPESRTERMWAAFGTPEGDTYASAMDACSPTARVRSRAMRAAIPIGEFDTLLAIDYPPARCADAGLTSELYLPYIGLVRRVETTIAGPVTYDLVYARLGGVTVVTAPPEVSFTVAVSADTPPGHAFVRMALRNVGADPLTLNFSSAQRYDVILRNEKGEVAYQWSRGRGFAQVLGTLTVTGEKNFTLDVPLAGLPAGKYAVEAWLTTSPVLYRAQAPIEIK